MNKKHLMTRKHAVHGNTKLQEVIPNHTKLYQINPKIMVGMYFHIVLHVSVFICVIIDKKKLVTF